MINAEQAYEIQEVKEVFYDILHSAVGNNGQDVQQNLGVSLSKAVQRDGVNIIQIQNVNSVEMIDKVIKGLRVLDGVTSMPVPIPIKQIEAPKVETPLHEAAQTNMSMHEVIDRTKIEYIRIVGELNGFNIKHACESVGVSQGTYYSAQARLRKGNYEITEVENKDELCES